MNKVIDLLGNRTPEFVEFMAHIDSMLVTIGEHTAWLSDTLLLDALDRIDAMNEVRETLNDFTEVRRR